MDNYYIRIVGDAIIQKMRKYLYIPEVVKKSLIKALLQTDVKYVVKDRRGKIISKGVVEGTVRSGDATKTTFGNTLRVVLYLQWAMKGAEYDYVIWVAGDDASVWFEERFADDVMRRMFEKVYTTDPCGKTALGQCAKTAEINNHSNTFLSRAIVKSDKGYTVGRLPERAVISGRYTDGKLSAADHADARMHCIKSWGKRFDIFKNYIPTKDLVDIKMEGH